MITEWQATNSLISKAIETARETTTYFVKVMETDGIFVKVMPFTTEKGMEALDKIPIMQSKYFSPIVQKDDVGLLIDIKLDLSNLLNSNTAGGANRQTYFIFIPFNLIASFESNADTFEIKSPKLQDSISVTDEMIQVKTSKSLYVGSNDVNVLNEISEYLNELKGFFDKFAQNAPTLAAQPGPGSAQMQTASQQMSQKTQEVYDKISEIVKAEG